MKTGAASTASQRAFSNIACAKGVRAAGVRAASIVVDVDVAHRVWPCVLQPVAVGIRGARAHEDRTMRALCKPRFVCVTVESRLIAAPSLRCQSTALAFRERTGAVSAAEQLRQVLRILVHRRHDRVERRELRLVLM